MKTTKKRAAKIEQLEYVGECLNGVWKRDQWRKPILRLLKRGKKLSRQQFVRRTREGGRQYAENYARLRVPGFKVSQANYREGVANGRQVVVMSSKDAAWLFVQHPEINIWSKS